MALSSRYTKFLNGDGILRRFLTKLSVEAPAEAGASDLLLPAHAVVEITPGTEAAMLGKQEDAAHSSGSTGVMALAVRKDTAVVLSDADGDYTPLIVDAIGRIHTVGPRQVVISATPTIDTGAYAAGDLIGGKLTFANAVRVAAGCGEVLSVVLADKDAENAEIDLVLFDSDPTGTTFTDQAAFDIADADLAKIIGVFRISDYASFADNSVGLLALRLPFSLPSGTSLYGALVSRGAPTYASSSDLTVRLGIVQS